MGTENINLGTCTIDYDGTDLGLTIGGVEVVVETQTHKTSVDQFGDTVVAERITGRNITVSLPLAETTLDNLVAIMPGATKVGSDPYKVEVQSGTGISLLALAKKLTLHPVELPTNDKSRDLIIPKAATAGGMQFAYKSNEEQVYSCEFMGYPDTDNGDILFIYGDEAAV